MATITISNVNSAAAFLRYALRNLVDGSRLVKYRPIYHGGSYTNERVIAEAQALASRMKPQDAARFMVAAKAAKGVRFGECRCQRCGATLTAPESVAAGIGPECMAK